MRMGLIGFADETYLGNLLMTRNRHLRWERWPFAEADALWVNGQHVVALPDHMVRVPSAHSGQPAAVLNLREIGRPVAFTLPLATGLQPPESFDPRVAASVARILTRFEKALMPLAVRLVLAAELARRRDELSSPTYHLSVDGQVVAVVNVNGNVGIAPHLTPDALAGAHWGGRPSAASAIPAAFATTSMVQVMWQYATRAHDDLLPARFRSAPLHLRSMPAVDPRLLRNTHLRVISALKAGPRTVSQLREATGMSDAAVLRAITALYFAGSIALDAPRATSDGPARTSGAMWATRPSFSRLPHAQRASWRGAAAGDPHAGRRDLVDMPTVWTPQRGEDG